jgi:hypothetical protein
MLKPNNIAKYYPQMALAAGVDEDQLSDMIDFFYKELALHMTHYKSHSLRIPGFGVLTLRFKRAKILLQFYEKTLPKLQNPETFSQMEKKKKMEDMRENLIVAMASLEDMINTKKEIKKRRYEARSKNSMEESGTDS